MFDIGFWELCIIAIIGLIVLGPERLPTTARKVGLWIGKTRQWMDDIKYQVDHELKMDELKKNIKKAEQTAQQNLKKVKQKIEQTTNEHNNTK